MGYLYNTLLCPRSVGVAAHTVLRQRPAVTTGRGLVMLSWFRGGTRCYGLLAAAMAGSFGSSSLQCQVH